MARNRKVDFENQLKKVEDQISVTQSKLQELENEKKQILQMKKEYELEQLYQLASSQGMSIQDVMVQLNSSNKKVDNKKKTA